MTLNYILSRNIAEAIDYDLAVTRFNRFNKPFSSYDWTSRKVCWLFKIPINIRFQNMMRTLWVAVFHTKTEKKKTSKFSFCVWGLRKSWDFHEIEEKKKKFTGHAYFRGQIMLSHRIVTSQITPFCKIHGASHVSFGLSRVTRDTLPSSDKIAPLWHVADGRKRYSQRTSKSGESRVVMTESRCWIRK